MYLSSHLSELRVQRVICQCEFDELMSVLFKQPELAVQLLDVQIESRGLDQCIQSLREAPDMFGILQSQIESFNDRRRFLDTLTSIVRRLLWFKSLHCLAEHQHSRQIEND